MAEEKRKCTGRALESSDYEGMEIAGRRERGRGISGAKKA